MHLVRDILRLLLGVKGYTYLRFFLTHKYSLNLNNPKSFSEKIIYRKFFVDPSHFSKFVDKYVVRDFVESRIGSEYLIPLLFCKDNLSTDDFINLPNQFVIKTSHGGGGKNVLVVNDKNILNISEIVKLFNHQLKVRLGSKIDELFYDIEKPRVLVESLISNGDGSPLLDYKFHRFNNDGDAVYYLQINSEYNTSRCTKTLYDINGLKSDVQFSGYNYGPEKIVLPENFHEMLSVVDKLASDFEYVRVDLFNVEGKIYFGELTFCPASGWDKVNTKVNDFMLGNFWKEFE
ncbi:ATP-grasp fold amidoligase family protein [Vibrio cholerae]